MGGISQCNGFSITQGVLNRLENFLLYSSFHWVTNHCIVREWLGLGYIHRYYFFNADSLGTIYARG